MSTALIQAGSVILKGKDDWKFSDLKKNFSYFYYNSYDSRVAGADFESFQTDEVGNICLNNRVNINPGMTLWISAGTITEDSQENNATNWLKNAAPLQLPIEFI
ncbi:hypothetical protein [uncultured Secundilactobacillus sp.]|uniref:hypothetical protein n=1 Tax=uncultured Secundilactobacillus sp. TaxID=2813935 RepID=UPI00258E03D9|nr:hypothetical protein [uncultured Secundilactobacillus sp.]